MSLSIVISAYNEEKKIEDCLKSAKFADEIVFVDNTSKDATAEIASKFTSKIFTRPNNIMLNINKNFGISKATSDWILVLDADERITSQLQREIRLAIEQSNNRTMSYWIPRKNIIFGKWIESEMWWPDYQLRLIRRGAGKFPQKHVHEYLKVDGETEKLKNPMLHYNYSSIDQYLYKMLNIYVPSEVKNRESYRVNWVDSLRFPASDFLKTFFLQKGYRDGLHGLVLSLLQAFYMEIVFVKLWEKRGFRKETPKNFLEDIYKEFKTMGKEFKYWFLTSRINETRNPLKKVIFKVARKRIKI